MVEVSNVSSDRREAGKFLRSPLGHYLAYRAYGGTLGKDTTARLKLGAIYHKRERQMQHLGILAGCTRELKPMGQHLLRALAVPWAAATLSPDEEARVIEESDVVGKYLVLDPNKCRFFDMEKKKRERKKPRSNARRKRRGPSR